MKLSNAEILEAYAALKTVVKLHIPVRPAMRVAKLARVVEGAAQDVEAVRAKLVDKYAEKKNGKPVSAGENGVKLEDPEGFQAEYRELLSVETELEATPLKLGEWGDIEVEPAVLMGLGPLVTD